MRKAIEIALWLGYVLIIGLFALGILMTSGCGSEDKDSNYERTTTVKAEPGETGSDGRDGTNGSDGQDGQDCTLEQRTVKCAHRRHTYDVYVVCGDQEEFLKRRRVRVASCGDI